MALPATGAPPPRAADPSSPPRLPGAETGPQDVQPGGIPPRNRDPPGHLPHANCEASLDFETRNRLQSHARRHRGAAAVDASPPPWARPTVQSLAQVKELHLEVPALPGRPRGSHSMVPLPDTGSAGSRQATDFLASHGRCAAPSRPTPALKDTLRRHTPARPGSAPRSAVRACRGAASPHRQYTVGAIQQVSFNISLPIDRRQHA